MSSYQDTERFRTAANIRWAMVPDRTAATAPGRAAMERKFEDAVDPRRELSPAERAKRVKNLKSAYYSSIKRGRKFVWPEAVA